MPKCFKIACSKCCDISILGKFDKYFEMEKVFRKVGLGQDFGAKRKMKKKMIE